MTTTIKAAILLLLLGATPCFAQKWDLREQTFTELLSIIEHPFEFLGKTDTAIATASRPATIIGGYKWKVKVKKTNSDDLDASVSIVIGTGCGGMLLMVSKYTGLVYNLIYLPHHDAHISGHDIIGFLKDKYHFNQEGFAFYESDNNGTVGMSALEGALLIGAVQDGPNDVRFLH